MGDEWHSGEGIFGGLVMSGQLVSLVEILTLRYFKTFSENQCKFPLGFSSNCLCEVC